MKFIVSVLVIFLFIYQVKGHFDDDEDHEIERRSADGHHHKGHGGGHGGGYGHHKGHGGGHGGYGHIKGMEVVMVTKDTEVVMVEVMGTKDMEVAMAMVMVEAMDIIKYTTNKCLVIK
ncbi:unnamed protein product [Lepeophtheirus salmonis]|uniref:(salmon louse) hypothetical protein n=1 Tax=Lepeophtheirus salmonis TaxID=72036 RepID=A0A7R8CPT1_LEPSM|nr:unnamed protein product [Lepeophtheirus salmonis]CAF2888690.1 unnamed protein product [Lepeophtheirus salmonis]